MKTPVIEIDFPAWIENFVNWDKTYVSDEEKISFAIDAARENVLRASGGPFGAAIFDAETGKLISVGINQVVRLNNSALHAETVAIMTAQNALQTYNLKQTGKYELFTSCEPCCMCLGAILWSGVKRLVCAATKEDATRVGFDEGPVYESSYEYLRERGIEIIRNFQREIAVEVFDLYRDKGGIIYNG